MASDAVEVVHDASTCVMVDIVVAVTSRVVVIDVASRLLLNSSIGVRAGSSHSGGTSQHLAGLLFRVVRVGLASMWIRTGTPTVRVRFANMHN